MKIMLIDDEESLQSLMSSIMRKAGYDFCGYMDGEGAVEAVLANKPDLVLLDVNLPHRDGFEICKDLRAGSADMPIVFLSARGDISDKAVGFVAGGDDYFSKPFDPRELIMHIEAIMRREQRLGKQVAQGQMDGLRVGVFRFDQAKNKLFMNDVLVDTSPKEYGIMFTLACNAGEVVSNRQLVENAWGEEYVENSNSLAVYIRRIRRKIEKDPSHPRFLRTSWGLGYVLYPDGNA